MKRSEVEKVIAEMEVLASEKKMTLMLYASDPDDKGFDIGSERLIVMTRVKLKNADKFKESEFVAELVKLSQGDPSAKVQKLAEKDEDADKLVNDLEELEGVRSARLSKYEVHIEKAKLFGWEEVVPKVLEVLEEFGLKKEFKLKGVTGVSAGNA